MRGRSRPEQPERDATRKSSLGDEDLEEKSRRRLFQQQKNYRATAAIDENDGVGEVGLSSLLARI